MVNGTHAREARVRRALARGSMRLSKDRARTWSIDHQQGYMIVSDRNAVVDGARWDLTLEQAEHLAGLR